MRAMKNYAGHRLSPWLGHLMVSRQETARPLLTPGEVMQLPVEDELVLVSGVAPIRAKKARYYTDRRLAERVLPPPQLSAADAGVGMSANDWSGLAVSSGPTIPAVAGTAARLPTGDHANAGIRREPELPDHEEIVAEISTPTREFSFEEQDSEDGAVRAQVLRDQIRGLPRQSAMDPDDGLGL